MDPPRGHRRPRHLPPVCERRGAPDFCALGGLLAWTTPDDHPHATTAHRSFHFVEPEAGGIRLESGETPCKYTVYLIDTSGCMLVGDVTV